MSEANKTEFLLITGEPVSQDLIDAIDLHHSLEVQRMVRKPNPSGAGWCTAGVMLRVDSNSPAALEAQSARQLLRALREVLRLGFGEDALNGHIGLDTPNPQTQDKITALFKQLQLMLDLGAGTVGQPKTVRQEVDCTNGITSSETATVVQHAGSTNTDQDPLHEQAVELVRKDRKASISYVQRKLRVSYIRAAAMLEAMEKAGIVSHPSPISGAREVIA